MSKPSKPRHNLKVCDEYIERPRKESLPALAQSTPPLPWFPLQWTKSSTVSVLSCPRPWPARIPILHSQTCLKVVPGCNRTYETLHSHPKMTKKKGKKAVTSNSREY